VKKHILTGLTRMAAFLALALSLHASTFVHITADNSYIDANNANLVDVTTGENHTIVYKPDLSYSWLNAPWIDTTHSWQGASSIGMEIDPSTADRSISSGVDKVNILIAGGHQSFALTNGVQRYTGFAVMLPSATNDVPTDRYLFAQWWQGSPYAPPVALDIIPNTNPIEYHIVVHNTDTWGNPSAVPIVIPVPGGNLSFDTWHTVVVMVIPDYYGYNGEITLWEDGQQLVDWQGKVGYDPSVRPYAQPDNPNVAYPNQNLNVYFGPYRNRQNTTQQLFFDEIRFTDTYAEAVP